MLRRFYSKCWYKYLDILRKFGFFCRRLKYLFHPDIFLGKDVKIGKNVDLAVLFGGSIKIGDNTEVLDGCKIYTYGGTIIIGNNCSINPYTIVYGHGGTTIGNNVLIAGQSMIIPANHIFLDVNQLISDQGIEGKGITINDNVWIGQGVCVLDNVIIEKGAVVAAGSVVNKNVEQYSIIGGVPARVIKKYYDKEEI